MRIFLLLALRRCLRIVHIALAALGLVVLVVVASPFTAWYARLLAQPWPDPDGDVLIILAGSDSESGILGESTYLRCAYAVWTFRKGSFRRVVVSGGSTALEMRDFLVYHGVPAGLIETETDSKTTRESALLTRVLLTGVPGRKVLLTSDYHTFRASRTFHRAGLDVTVSPFPDAIKRSQHFAGRMPAFLYEVQETFKIAYYFYHGWI